jgi:predicted O-methyltransferase YrrM
MRWAKAILEFGTLGAYSTIRLARALAESGCSDAFGHVRFVRVERKGRLR